MSLLNAFIWWGQGQRNNHFYSLKINIFKTLIISAKSLIFGHILRARSKSQVSPTIKRRALHRTWAPEDRDHGGHLQLMPTTEVESIEIHNRLDKCFKLNREKRTTPWFLPEQKEGWWVMLCTKMEWLENGSKIISFGHVTLKLSIKKIR